MMFSYAELLKFNYQPMPDLRLIAYRTQAITKSYSIVTMKRFGVVVLI